MSIYDKDALVFAEGLRRLIHDNLKRFQFQSDEESDARRAAVALVVVRAGHNASLYGMVPCSPFEAALVLTRRAESLKQHAGQWALPGGSIDSGESVVQAALRELKEEVGLCLGEDDVLGRLDDFTTRSGFVISPVVFWGGDDPTLRLNHSEVASVHRIPLREFMRDDAPVLNEIPESSNPVLLMPVGQGWIASPTGAIIYQFREVALLGDEVRVAHFEQPYFAWK